MGEKDHQNKKSSSLSLSLSGIMDITTGFSPSHHDNGLFKISSSSSSSKGVALGIEPLPLAVEKKVVKKRNRKLQLTTMNTTVGSSSSSSSSSSGVSTNKRASDDIDNAEDKKRPRGLDVSHSNTEQHQYSDDGEDEEGNGGAAAGNDAYDGQKKTKSDSDVKAVKLNTLLRWKVMEGTDEEKDGPIVSTFLGIHGITIKPLL